MVVAVDLGKIEEEAAAENVGRKVLSVLNETYRLGSVTFISSAGVGITLFKGDSIPVGEQMKQADLAMYRSKETGLILPLGGGFWRRRAPNWPTGPRTRQPRVWSWR